MLRLTKRKGMDKGTIIKIRKPSASPLGVSQNRAIEPSYPIVENVLIKKKHKAE
jgi:hypothetical protein